MLRLLTCSLLVLLLPGVSLAAEGLEINIVRPTAYEVVQRRGYVPAEAHLHQPGGAKLGAGKMPIEWELAEGQNFPAGARFEYSLSAADEQPANPATPTWEKFQPKLEKSRVSTELKLPAGGWYVLHFRALAAEAAKNPQPIWEGKISPVGVGEVFVVAGQSYACGHNDELQKVEEKQQRVVAYDVVKKTWRVAHDPQPNLADGGTIWPATGDLLVPIAQVPVGFVNVAVGATSSSQWLPGQALHQQLSAAGLAVKDFRAVLWQQGESDVLEKKSTADYVANMVRVRDGAAKAWGFNPPWLLAKSTLHPTVYNEPVLEGQIRAGYDQLIAKHQFRPGPDTDILAGENRGGPETRRHFSAIGQRRAALMWFSSIWQDLQRGDAH